MGAQPPHNAALSGPATRTHQPGPSATTALGQDRRESRPPFVVALVVVAGLALAGGAWAIGNQTPPPAAPEAAPTSETAASTAPNGNPTSASPTSSPSPTSTAGTSAARTASPTTAAPAATGGTLVDVSGVTDGDTIKVRVAGSTERVRLIGIDTPELSPAQCYAQQAASKMQSLVQSKQVVIVADPTQSDRDTYGRLLRHVYLTDGQSVAQLMIADGFGKEYTYEKPYRGQAEYRAAQASAQSAGKGQWGAQCVPPPPAPEQVAPAPSPSSAACLIKGNISGDGEKIYHVPGQRYYDETKIDTTKGERWFCTRAAAQAAGWRAAKV
jgi:micrococcal nuclease